MAIKPFEYILGAFDPNEMNTQTDGDINTGIKYNGKNIYKRTIDIQDVALYVPEAHSETFVRIEGTFSDGVYQYPLKWARISSTGIELDGQTILPTYTGSCDLYYTETIVNEDPMTKFTVTVASIIAIIVATLSYVGVIEPKHLEAFTNLFGK